MRLLYLSDCPHWAEAERRLREALHETGHPNEPVELVEIPSTSWSRPAGYHGSPTILIDGVDPFPHDHGAAGPACRPYTTPVGVADLPSTAQLATALAIHL